MSREKYLANIDRILEDVVRRNSKNVGNKNTIPYSEALEENGSIKKVAFDVYKVADDPYHNLWAMENINGVPYLVRASDPQSEEKVFGDWTAITSNDRSNVTLAYKKVPIARFSSDKFGFSKDDVITFKSALLDNTKNENFIKDVLQEQPESKRLALMSEFPEFKKFIKG
jgi:hypothetical protein